MRARIAAAGTVLLVVVAWFVGVKVGERRAQDELLGSGDRKPSGTPIATFAGGQVTVEQVQALLPAMGAPVRASLTTLEARRQLVRDLARTTLLAREARRRGLQHDTGLALQHERSLAMLLTRRLDAEAEAGAASLSEEVLRAYYDQHRADFVRPERVRVAVVFLAAPGTAASRDSKRAEAQALLAQVRRDELADPGRFARLARERSDDLTSAPAGGDLSFASREELGARVSPELAQAAFGLTEIGRTGERVLETSRGFYLLRLLGREPALDLPFAQVREPIHQRLASERRAARQAELLAQLEKQADLRLDEAALQSLRIEPEAPAAEPPAALQAGGAESDLEVAK